MANGFPDGDFRIINAGTGDRLFVRYGGVSKGMQKGVDKLTGETGYIEYSHTNDPFFEFGTPDKKDYDLWWFSTIEDPWHRPDHYLMTSYKDIRSRFALTMMYREKEVILPGADYDAQFSLTEELQIPPFRVAWKDPFLRFEKMASFITDDKQRNAVLSAYAQVKPTWSEDSGRQCTHDDLFMMVEAFLEEELHECLQQAREQYRKEHTKATQWYLSLTKEEKKARASEREQALDVLNEKRKTAPRQVSAIFSMVGNGRTGISRWKTENGYIFEQDNPDLVLTIQSSEEDKRLCLQTRGSALHQQWVFEKK